MFPQDREDKTLLRHDLQQLQKFMKKIVNGKN